MTPKDKHDTKVALITGGIGALGFASAQKMAGMGMGIAILDKVDGEKADARVQALSGKGRVLYLKADVTDRTSVEKALDILWGEFDHLDICMCNAGIVIDLPFLEFTVEQLQQPIDVNLNG